MLARRFLYIIAALIFLILAAAVAYRLFGQELLRAALVPAVEFADSPQDAAPNYAHVDAWDAHPALPRNPTSKLIWPFPRIFAEAC